MIELWINLPVSCACEGRPGLGIEATFALLDFIGMHPEVMNNLHNTSSLSVMLLTYYLYVFSGLQNKQLASLGMH